MSCPFAQTNVALHRSGFPDAPFPDPSLYENLGEQTITNVIRYQHQLLWKSDIHALYGDDLAHFKRMVEYTVYYFIEMLGGPKLFTPLRGEARLGRRHKVFLLTPYHRKVWLECLRKALYQFSVPAQFAQPIWDWVEPLSMRFLVPRVPVEELTRESLFKSEKDYD
ncbi:hypothetical protein JCM30760_20660 [Thiomicrorhabdus hydrogeniphila]